MPNRWIEFVKSWAKKMNISYGCALSDPKLKLAYRKAYPTKAMTKLNETKERFKMSGEDIQSRMAQQLEKETKETETMGAEDRNVAYKKPISSEKRYNRITDNKLKEYNKLKEEYNRVREEARKTKDANLIKKAKKLKAEAEQLATEITEPKKQTKEIENMGMEDIRGKLLQTAERKSKAVTASKLANKANKLKKLPSGRAEFRDKAYKDMVEKDRLAKEKERLAKEIETMKAEDINAQEKKAVLEEIVEDDSLKPKRGEVIIEPLDENGIRKLFDRYYNSGSDELMISVKAPNGNYYDENDYNMVTQYVVMKTKRFSSLEPLAKFLQKRGLIKIVRYKK